MPSRTRPILAALTLGALLTLPVSSCDRPAPAPPHPAVEQAAPTTAILNLTGVIGVEIRAELLEHYCADSQPNHIVLRIDSTGGILAEVAPIVDAIDSLWRDKGIPVTAWVDRAESSAALIALACDNIVMVPAGVLGGAIAYEYDADGKPRVVEGDLLDAIRQTALICAQRGDHDPAIPLALVEPIGLAVRTTDGAPQLATQRTSSADGWTILTRPGEVLTLNSITAQRIGLSLGVANDRDGLTRLLTDLAPNWTDPCAESYALQSTLSRAAADRAQFLMAVVNREITRLTDLPSVSQNDAATIDAALGELSTLAAAHPWLARGAGLSTNWLIRAENQAAKALTTPAPLPTPAPLR